MVETPIQLPEVQVEAERDLPIPPIPPNLRPAGTPPAPTPAPAPQAPEPPEPPEPQAAPTFPDDTVTLEVAGMRFTGWQDVRVVRGIEVFPSHFALRLTEALPLHPGYFAIEPGQTCRLRLGADLVISGYVDDYRAQVSPRGHEVTVIGRSGTADLVDCACGVQEGKEKEARMTFRAPNLLTLARDLCAPFGIKVSAPDGEGKPLVSSGDGIPQFTIPLGTPAMQVLEPIARWRQRILMDDTAGNLVIAAVGTKRAASGFTMPGAVERAQVGFSKQNRYTVYLPSQFNFDRSFQEQDAAPTAGGHFEPVKDEGAFRGQKRLDGKPRYRPQFVISEQSFETVFLAEQRAKWQKGRDFGRSQAVTVTCPLWRDRSGVLWAPNTLAPIDIPALKLRQLTWVIAQVAYLKGFEGGTRTVVTLMPREAFVPEPSFYTPYDPQVAQADRETAQARGAERAAVQQQGSRSIAPGAGANGNPRGGDAPGV